MEDYININKKLWNYKTKYHINSAFYNNENFKRTKNSLNNNELEALGDVSGKTILHLQCHFGQDTLSWQNLDAQCTGVDFSDEAINYAKQLNIELSLGAEFICCDVYDLKNHLHKKFDIVFTSYGTIGWLPDLDKWAEIISHFLKPGGTFYMIDFHPLMWMFDSEFTKFQYSYFNHGPIVEENAGTYADKNAPIKNKEVGWNHSISEILNALLQKGLRLVEFNEYDYANYNCFQKCITQADGTYVIEGMEKTLPMMYSIKCSI